jgi:hypothetical protein
MTTDKEKFFISVIFVLGIYAIAFFLTSCATPKKREIKVGDCLQHYLFKEASAGLVQVLDVGSNFYMVMSLSGNKYRFLPEYMHGNYVQVSCEKAGF